MPQASCGLYNLDTQTAEKPKVNQAEKNVALVVATVASFLAPYMGSSVSVALPAIGREFGMNAVLIGWIPTSYLLAAAAFLVPIGRIADIYGRKKIFIVGMIVYTAASLLIALSFSSAMIISMRVLQGLGGSMIFGTSIAIITSIFPPGERGRALGINSAAVYLGLSLGPFMGGFLTHALGWRGIFVVNVPLGLLVVGFTIWKLKGEWAGARGERFDWFGSIIFGLGLVALVYGFSRLPSLPGAGLITLGILGLVGFVLWEIRTKSPILDIRLFRNALFAFSNLSAFLNYCAIAAVGFLMSLYLQYIKGFDPRGAGMVLVIQPIVMVVFSPLTGRLSDRIEPRFLASAGMAVTATGLFLMASMSNATPLWFIFLTLVVLGFGIAMFSSPNTNAVMCSVEKRFCGVTTGILDTMRVVGQAMGLAIVTLIFALFMGRAEITPQLYPQFLESAKVAFVIFGALCTAGMFASLARGRVRPRDGS